MTEATTFRQGYLAGCSYRASNVPELLSGKYDLMLVTSSWDSRCRCVTEAKDLSAALAVGIFFDKRDSKGLRNKHDAELNEFCSRRSESVKRITGQSTNVEGIWKQLREVLLGQHKSVKKPLSVFIDLSSCPRCFSLGVLAFCLSQRIAKSVTMFYAEGRYSEDSERSEFAFTGGHWRTVPVPCLEGVCAPGKECFYLVSIGFEGSRTLRIVSRADPYRVSILFPNPGTHPDYIPRTERNNQELMNQFRVPPEQIVHARAGDAVDAWRALAKASLDRPEKENSFYVCCGTKAHAVALALRALSLEYPAVLYNIPEEHRVHETQPSGNYWRFDIRDVSALP